MVIRLYYLQPAVVVGWIKTKNGKRNFGFLSGENILNDGFIMSVEATSTMQRTF